MPSRVLREAILDSEAVNALSVPAELFYRRLMSVVDDFGRFDARPPVLRSRCYPLRVASVREADISRWLAECEAAGLIVLYSSNGSEYLLFRKLGEPRAKTSKFPAPPAGADNCIQMRADVSTCAQTRADVPYSDSGSGSDSKRKTAVFVPPTVEEVAEHVRSKGYGIDPEFFVAHYTSNGWVQSNGQKIKDWRAATVTWEKRRKASEKGGTPSPRLDKEGRKRVIDTYNPDTMGIVTNLAGAFKNPNESPIKPAE